MIKECKDLEGAVDTLLLAYATLFKHLYEGVEFATLDKDEQLQGASLAAQLEVLEQLQKLTQGETVPFTNDSINYEIEADGCEGLRILKNLVS